MHYLTGEGQPKKSNEIYLRKNKGFLHDKISENHEELENKLGENIAELNEEEVLSGVDKALEMGIEPFKIVKYLSKGLEEVGERFRKGTYFVVDLIQAGDIMNLTMEKLEPHLQASGEEAENEGVVVFGTVEGDLHDIGKNIVITLLKASGFKIHDLGVDTPKEEFVEKTKEEEPDVLAMTALLTNVLDEIKDVIAELEEEGLRSELKIAVGGAAVSESFAQEIGAEIYADSAPEAVTEFKRILGN